MWPLRPSNEKQDPCLADEAGVVNLVRKDGTMAQPLVSDELWEIVEPLIPRVPRRQRYPGRKRTRACARARSRDLGGGMRRRAGERALSRDRGDRDEAARAPFEH